MENKELTVEQQLVDLKKQQRIIISDIDSNNRMLKIYKEIQSLSNAGFNAKATNNYISTTSRSFEFYAECFRKIELCIEELEQIKKDLCVELDACEAEIISLQKQV